MQQNINYPIVTDNSDGISVRDSYSFILSANHSPYPIDKFQYREFRRTRQQKGIGTIKNIFDGKKNLVKIPLLNSDKSEDPPQKVLQATKTIVPKDLGRVEKENAFLKDKLNQLKTKYNSMLDQKNSVIQGLEGQAVNSKNTENTQDTSTITNLKKELFNKNTEIERLKRSTNIAKNENIHVLMDELNLSANARKFYKAILHYCTDEKTWTPISSKILKQDYRVHTAHFSSARLELKDHKLIDFREAKEHGTNRPTTEYVNLKN